MKRLRQALHDYLGMRRSLGFKLQRDGTRLSNFVSFLEQRGAAYITTRLALKWAQQTLSAGSEQRNRLMGVRGFARYRGGADPRTEIPPLDLLPPRRQGVRPYLYTEDDIQRLLKATRKLNCRTELKAHTYYCLFGLLAVSGLRIGEAIRLKCEDVGLTEGVLTIVRSKFGKSRLVPLHPTTRTVLSDYKERRDRYLAGRPADHFFISGRGTPLRHHDIYSVFNSLSVQVGLRDPSASRGPRLHDFRHRFAVETLLRWYRSGGEIEPHLPQLATFLGHVCIANTYTYLTQCPELMGEVVKRLEGRWEAN
jgi:integrase/recombinase XerD